MVVGVLEARQVPVHAMSARLGVHGFAIHVVLGERDVLRRIDAEDHEPTLYDWNFWH